MLETDVALRSNADVVHVIQVALTPVFLLSGIALLLNVFALRLARVADRVHAFSAMLVAADSREQARLRRGLKHLLRRSHLLDAAVALAAAGGVATCAAVNLLFLGTLRDQAISRFLLVTFGSALLCISGALLSFLAEVLMASYGIRNHAAPVSRDDGGGRSMDR